MSSLLRTGWVRRTRHRWRGTLTVDGYPSEAATSPYPRKRARPRRARRGWSMPVTDVLDKLRASSTSEFDKGARFERMMRSAFRLDRTYHERFTDVWLWSDWPGRGAEPDTGIDLVAKNAAGGYTAIQSKFFAEDQHLVKADIDSFFTASGRAPFTERIIVCTTDLWSTNSERALDRQDKPVTRIGVDELQ